ncbi:hypothetical protein CEXT_319721 [Caerostris extrusa]|uniref:Uncharacterized protein n=1 Tax=Caerostris extrusa TaxID=172846 RepID=A0AAV4MTW1_CAEEX|nr:hypothetical protein CEXT_319721 [Caerostris extrusa]
MCRWQPILEHNTNKNARGQKFRGTTPLEHLEECDKQVGSIEFSLFRNKHQVVKIDGSTKLTCNSGWKSNYVPRSRKWIPGKGS